MMTSSLLYPRNPQTFFEIFLPKTYEDIIGNTESVDAVKRNGERAKKDGRRPYDMVLYGPPGCGKTAVTRVFAYSIFKNNAELRKNHLYLNGNDTEEAGGIKALRDRVTDFAKTATRGTAKYKLIIVDEADGMSNKAQEYLKVNIAGFGKCCWIFIANRVSKLNPALRSRCMNLPFKRPTSEDLLKVACRIAKEKRPNMDINLLRGLSKSVRKDVRDIVFRMSQLCDMKEPSLKKLNLGATQANTIISTMISYIQDTKTKDADRAFRHIRLAVEDAEDFDSVCESLAETVCDPEFNLPPTLRNDLLVVISTYHDRFTRTGARVHRDGMIAEMCRLLEIYSGNTPETTTFAIKMKENLPRMLMKIALATLNSILRDPRFIDQILEDGTIVADLKNFGKDTFRKGVALLRRKKK